MNNVFVSVATPPEIAPRSPFSQTKLQNASVADICPCFDCILLYSRSIQCCWALAVGSAGRCTVAGGRTVTCGAPSLRRARGSVGYKGCARRTAELHSSGGPDHGDLTTAHIR